MKSKAQISLTFNWMYVLIAGGVILLFFFGIVIRQKAVSEQQLGTDLVETMQSIFTAASVAEKTKNFIDTAGLADYTLYFNCNEGVSEFGIEGTSTKADNAVNPLFSPLKIKSSRLITWSLPYKMPFKVMDFLMVTSPNTKYFIFGDPAFKREFSNATIGFDNVESMRDEEYDNINPQKNFQVRVVDLSGSLMENGIPASLQNMDNDLVTAVSFNAQGVNYYQKKGTGWVKLNRKQLPIISLSGERDAVKYAAIFAGNDKIYTCNMRKSLKRLQYVTEIYMDKERQLEEYYQEHPEFPSHSYCMLDLSTDPEGNMKRALNTLKSRAQSCSLSGDFAECHDIVEAAMAVKEANGRLLRDGCAGVY